MDIKFKSEQNSGENIMVIQDVPKCQICSKNKALYQCPRCNIPYCGLECYRNQEKHVNCSEDFYRDQVVAELKMCKLDDEDAESRNQIAGILKREAFLRAGGLNEDEESDEDIDEQKIDAVDTKNVADEDLLKIYSSQAQKWKPWWQIYESKSSLFEEIVQNTDEPKSLHLNLNLLKNSSSINISKASNLLHNDILLTYYSYLIISYIYQLDLDDDLGWGDEELVANFLHIDNQLINDSNQKNLGLRTRLDLALKFLTRADRNRFLKSYVSCGFLASVLDELVIFVERFDLQVQALSHVYDMFECFLKQSKRASQDTKVLVEDTPINVFYLKKVVKKVNDENLRPTRSSNIKILTPKTEKSVAEKKQEVNQETEKQPVNRAVSPKDVRVFLKRLEFYYRWLCFNKSKLYSAESIAQMKETIQLVKDDFASESKQFDDEKEFFNKNLAKLRSSRVQDTKPVATLIQEL